MERKLASIQIIADLQPIEGADMIEVATVNSWKVVVKRGEFVIGDAAVYFEIDSFLPIREQYEFLRKSSFKRMDNAEGFRLKTIKLRGQISQGLLLPLKSVEPMGFVEEGQDVTETLEVAKYEPPVSPQLAGVRKGNFPSFIPKTDEERVQNLTRHYEGFKQNTFYITEKLDGSSITMYLNNDVFGVCSRNMDLCETEDNSFWKAARALGIESKLRKLGGNIALQGELVGEGIQGNKYGLQGQDVRFFNVYDIDKGEFYNYDGFTGFMAYFELTTVPILMNNAMLPDSIDELLRQAEGESILNPKTEREGLVIRSHDRKISFKAISNKFLLKEEA